MLPGALGAWAVGWWVGGGGGGEGGGGTLRLPHVALDRQRPAAQLLRRHGRGRALHVLRIQPAPARAQVPRRPEVAQPRRRRRRRRGGDGGSAGGRRRGRWGGGEDDVARVQVAEEEALRVRVRQSVGHLPRGAEGVQVVGGKGDARAGPRYGGPRRGPRPNRGWRQEGGEGSKRNNLKQG